MTQLRPCLGWHPFRSLQYRVPAELRPWLGLTGSLTAGLSHLAGCPLHVEIIAQGWFKPHADEALGVGLHRGEWAWVREVRLCVHGIPWIEARSVLPRRALVTWARPLYRLGNQPLGALLFRMPHIVRQGLLIRQDPSGCWRRFSLFGPPEGPQIRVQETYLPDLLHYLSSEHT